MFQIGSDVLPAVTVDRVGHHLYFPAFAVGNIGNNRIFFVDFEVFCFCGLNEPHFTFGKFNQLIGRAGKGQTTLVEQRHVGTRARNIANNVGRKDDNHILG